MAKLTLTFLLTLQVATAATPSVSCLAPIAKLSSLPASSELGASRTFELNPVPDSFINPVPPTLENIQKAAKKGITLVVPYNNPKIVGDSLLDYIAGAKLRMGGGLSDWSERGDGLFLHLHWDARVPTPLGEVNPLLSLEQLSLRTAKIRELESLRPFAPELFPRFHRMSDILSSDSRLDELRIALTEEVANYRALPRPASPADNYTAVIQAERAFWRRLRYVLRNRFRMPDFFLKFDRELQTGDDELTLNSRLSAKGRISALEDLLKEADEKGHLQLHTRYAAFLMQVMAGMTKGDGWMVQEAINPRRTENGHPMEFRVNVVAGNIVNWSHRWGYELYPREMLAARKTVADFLARLPKKYHYFSGGFDVLMGDDGRFHIIETNPGNSAGGFQPFENQAIHFLKGIERLTGQTPQFLQDLRTIVEWPDKFGAFIHGNRAPDGDQDSVLQRIPKAIAAEQYWEFLLQEWAQAWARSTLFDRDEQFDLRWRLMLISVRDGQFETANEFYKLFNAFVQRERALPRDQTPAEF